MASTRRGVSSKANISNMDFIMILNKYIPSLVLQQLIEREKKKNEASKLPELQPMETVVLFADISGFTKLSEACAKKGDRGNEELAFCINRYMEGMVTNLNQYGGDIIKFVGDAMIVMWPPINKELRNWEETRNDTIRRAIQCSQDIQKHMNNMPIMPGATLSVKIGIGYGQCALLYVGGVFGRSESFTIGEALMQALNSEGQATGGGQIIVAESCFQYVREFFKVKELVDEENSKKKFYLVDYKHAGARVKIQADSMKLRSQFSFEVLSRIQAKMTGSVAHSIIPYLQIDQERYGSENRSLTVMFVNLGVELSSADTPQGMAKIQKIVTAVQKQVYRLQGSLNKLVMDDKGSTLICLWGLLPFAHDDDASRALLAGYNMIKALNQIEDTYCRIGVSSGECFSGVVGTSGSRKEFSVLGDIVNLAARIMGTIKGQGLKNEIRCDLNTRTLAANFFDFTYSGHYELKGKSISIPFYKAWNPKIKFDLARQKVVQPENFLAVHMNPLFLEKNTEPGQRIRLLGFNEMMYGLVSDITEYYSDEEGAQQYPYMAVIKGELGSGKTAFARCLIDNLHEQSEFQTYLSFNKQKLPVFASTVNAETQLHFLNIWKPIIAMMTVFFCKQRGLKKEAFIADVITSTKNEDKVDLLCEITGVNKDILMSKRGSQFSGVEQIQPMMGETYFINRPEYTRQEKEDIIELLTNLIKCIIGEDSDVSGWNSIMDPRQKSRQDIEDENDQKPPFIIVMDNAHNMDPTSWQLLESVIEESYRIVVILLVQSDDMDRMKIHPSATVAFEQVWESITTQIEVVEKDLPRLSSEQIGDLIITNAQRYRSSFTTEMKEMTKIADYNNTIKDDEMGDTWKTILTNKWQLAYQMNQVDEDILNVVAKKCRGNPLLSLQYFNNLLHNEFLTIKQNGHVNGTDKFYHCMQTNDWTRVPVPRIALKQTSMLLDNFYYSIQSKDRKSRRPGELEGCTTAIVLLKAASVLGEEFELKALQKISPFPKSATTAKRVEEAIRNLEQRDLIEIVDETDQKNCVCRFNKCFLQESIYQTLLYKSCKKDLHTAAEKFIKTMPALTAKKDNSVITERLLQHMLLAQDTQDEDQLLFERRSALVVLRVQNQINKDPRGLVLKELLHKQGDSVNKNVSKRIVILTQFALKWYHDKEEEYERDHFMGQVNLPFIYEVVKSKQAGNERPSFMISVTMYLDKKREEKSKRDIFFSCDTEQARDQWVVAIDYLKTRAIYDAYAKKNTLVSFINHEGEEEQNREEHNERDLSNLLYDFGEQLKGSSISSAAIASARVFSQSNQVKESFINTRKQSIFRPMVEKSNITAHDLVPKLNLLYKIGMTSWLHHLEQKNFKTRAVVAKNAVGKQGADLERMQFPNLNSWDVNLYIEDNLAMDAERNIPGASSNRSTGRDSTISLTAYANSNQNHVFQQLSSSSLKDMEAQKLKRTNEKTRSSSEHHMMKDGTTRRSSSISADHVMSAANQHVNLPITNSLIKEVKEEDSSDKSDNGLSKLTSSNTNKNGRFSEEVQQQTITQLQKNLSDEKKMRQQNNINYKNSTDSSKGLSSPTPIATTNTFNNANLSLPGLLSQEQRSFSGPVEMNTDRNINNRSATKDEASNQFGEQLQVITNGTLDRENRQTFASHKGEEEPIQPQFEQHMNHSRQKIANMMESSRDESSQQIILEPYNDAAIAAAKQKRLNDSSGSRVRKRHTHHNSVGPAGGGLGQTNSFAKSNSTDQQQKNSYIANDLIGKEADNKELSRIQHRYDSRYQEMISNSMLDPLMAPNTMGAPNDHASSGTGGNKHDESSYSHKNHRTEKSGGNSEAVQSQQLMANLGSMIKQQLGQGLNDILQEQKEKMNRMAEQQQQLMQEQMSKHQQSIHNSSMTQPQPQQPQMSPIMAQRANPQYPPQNQYQQQLPPQNMMRLRSQQQQQQYPQASQIHHQASQGMNQSSYMSQAALMSQGSNVQLNQQYPAQQQHPHQGPPYHYMNQHQMYSNPQMQSYNPALNNRSFVSEVSMGGLTSKRSHKHLLENSMPVASKDESHHDELEPADPMIDEQVQDYSGDPSMYNNRLHMQRSAQQPPESQGPPPSYELDLQQYMQMMHPSPQTAHQQNQAAMRGQKQSAVRSFHIPSQGNNNLLVNNLHDDNHTEHEAYLQQQQTWSQQPPSIRSGGAQYPQHEQPNKFVQNKRKPQPQHQQSTIPLQQEKHHEQSLQQMTADETVSAKTIKPSYQGLQTFDQMSQLSHLSPQNQQQLQAADNLQVYQYNQGQHDSVRTQPANYSVQHNQFQQQQQQLKQKPLPQSSQIEFADKPLIFPPPEKWTENQYAMFEEPLSSRALSNQTSVNPIAAVAITDSVDLKMHQIIIKKGTQVQVQEIISEAQICKIVVNGQLGLFKLQDFIKSDMVPSKSQTPTTSRKNKLTVHERQVVSAKKAYSKQHVNLLKQMEAQEVQDQMMVSIDVSNNTSAIRDYSLQGIEVQRHLQQRGGVGDSTIEQMSPIQSNHDKTHNSSHPGNFFRDDPEKTISKQLRGLTPKQLADKSKQLLEKDRAEHQQINLKMVERQKKRAAVAKRQSGTSTADKQRAQGNNK